MIRYLDLWQKDKAQVSSAQITEGEPPCRITFIYKLIFQRNVFFIVIWICPGLLVSTAGTNLLFEEYSTLWHRMPTAAKSTCRKHHSLQRSSSHLVLTCVLGDRVTSEQSRRTAVHTWHYKCVTFHTSSPLEKGFRQSSAPHPVFSFRCIPQMIFDAPLLVI